MKQDILRVPKEVARATNIGDTFHVKGEKYEVKSVRRGAGSEIELIKVEDEQTVELGDTGSGDITIETSSEEDLENVRVYDEKGELIDYSLEE